MQHGGILVLRPRIKPVPPALEVQVLNPWTTKEVSDLNLFKKKIYFYLFIYFWSHWVFIAMFRLSLVAATRIYSSLQHLDFSLEWLLLLWSTGSRLHRLQQWWHAGSEIATLGL